MSVSLSIVKCIVARRIGLNLKVVPQYNYRRSTIGLLSDSYVCCNRIYRQGNKWVYFF